MARRCAAILAICLFAAVFGAVPAFAQEDSGKASGAPASAQPLPVGYLANLPDIPLMAGLREIAGAGFAFEKPAGRLVEAYAQGALDRASLRRFYAETLPQLGWRQSAAERYRRGDEILELSYLGEDGDLIVRFSVRPE
jgi:hypothetical protein